MPAQRLEHGGRARRPARRGAGLVLLALLSIGAWPAAAEGLRIGVYGQDPPRSFVDADGKLRGLDVDVAHALCAATHIQCELVAIEWSALLPALETRRVDAVVASVSITDERRARVDFTRAYYRTPARFIAREGEVDGAAPASLAGKRIGVRRGTTFDAYVTEHYGAVAEVVRYSTQPDALLDLTLGRVDVVLGDAAVLEETFLATDHGEPFAFVGPPLWAPRWFGDGQGVAVAPGEPGLRGMLDRAVADISLNGVFERIWQRWFPAAAAAGIAMDPGFADPPAADAPATPAPAD